MALGDHSCCTSGCFHIFNWKVLCIEYLSLPFSHVCPILTQPSPYIFTSKPNRQIIKSKEQHPSTSIFLTHTNPATISLTLCTDSLTKLPGALRGQLQKKVPCWRAVLQVPVIAKPTLSSWKLFGMNLFKETSRVNKKTNYIITFFSHVQAPEWVVSLKVPFARPRRDYKPPRKPRDLVSLVALVVPRVRPCPAWTVPFQFLASHPYPWWHIQVIHAPSPIHPKFLQRQRKYHHVAVCLGWEHVRKAPVASTRSRGLPAIIFLRLVRTKALRGWRVKQPGHEAYQTHQEDKKRPLFEDGWWICFSILPLHSFPKFRNKKTLWATFSPAQKEKQRARQATRTNRGHEFGGPALYSCMGNGACRFGLAFGLGLGFNLSASNAMTFLACSRKALQRQWSIILMIGIFHTCNKANSMTKC